jgi:hypothetical protein
MVGNVSLAGRLFNFQPAATVKNNDPSQTAATARRRSFGDASTSPVDVTGDLCLPTVVRAASAWQSPLQPSSRLTHAAFAVTSSQGGSVALNKYLDQLGQIAAGSVTAAMTANSALVLDHSSTTILQSWSIAIANTEASAATLSNALCLLSK